MSKTSRSRAMATREGSPVFRPQVRVRRGRRQDTTDTTAFVTATAPPTANPIPTQRNSVVPRIQHAQAIARHAPPTSASITTVGQVTVGQASR